MFWFILALFLAWGVVTYLVGWSRGIRGLPRWPLSVGKGGIHTGPCIAALLAAAGMMVGCSTKHSAPANPPADSVVADSGHHDRDHDTDHGKHRGHEEPKKP